MVRHIVMWDYADGFTEEQNKANTLRMKEELENLTSMIEGIISLKVEINPMPSSNKAIILNSLFKDEEALNEYIVHPEHVRVGKLVRSVTKNRACFDHME